MDEIIFNHISKFIGNTREISFEEYTEFMNSDEDTRNFYNAIKSAAIEIAFLIKESNANIIPKDYEEWKDSK